MYSVGIDDITKNTSIINGEVIGEGIFDKLMETATLHLKAQFDEGRIRGEDFAQAYMAVYTANLNIALQILLQQHIAKLQADNLVKDLDVKEANISNIEKDNLIKDYQLSDVLPKEALKLQEEIDLLARQESELSLNGTADRAIKSSQKLLVDAQTITEGAKKLLIDRQKEGFDDKALLDTLKHLLDSWSVGFSVASDTPEFTGVPSSISKVVIDKFTKKIGDELDVNTGL